MLTVRHPHLTLSKLPRLRSCQSSRIRTTMLAKGKGRELEVRTTRHVTLTVVHDRTHQNMFYWCTRETYVVCVYLCLYAALVPLGKGTCELVAVQVDSIANQGVLPILLLCCRIRCLIAFRFIWFKRCRCFFWNQEVRAQLNLAQHPIQRGVKICKQIAAQEIKEEQFVWVAPTVSALNYINCLLTISPGARQHIILRKKTGTRYDQKKGTKVQLVQQP